MSFINGIFLFGLLGVIVPLIIHMWSKKSRQIIPFGSLQFLRNTTTRSMRSLMPSDIPMLILRMLIIACLSLLLSGVMLQNSNNSNTAVTLIDPTYADHSEIELLLDTADDIRFFTHGFPAFQKENIPASSSTYWSLQQQAQALPFTTINIVAPLNLDRFEATQTSLTDRINWISLPPNQILKEQVKNPIKVFLKSDQLADDNLMKTCLQTFSSDDQRIIQQVDSTAADWIIWLSDSLHENRRKLIIGTNQGPLLKQVGPEIWQLNLNKFSIEEVLKSHFLYQLELALGLNTRKLNQVELAPHLLSNKARTDKPITRMATSFDQYLWLLLLTLIIVERIIALKGTTT
ncbi:MAG: BatA domain-containing protein [Cyclobacteriaceae bacterium]